MITDSIKNRRLAGLFLLGCVAFNFPLLSLFNLERMLYGLPLFYVYIFSVWSVIIILLIIVTQRSSLKDKLPSSN
jgi:hypothetical protein